MVISGTARAMAPRVDESAAEVLVAGATGVLGSEVVRALTASGSRVRALSRRPFDAPFGSAISTVMGDVLRPETLRGACEGVDVVVSAVGGSLDLKRLGNRVPYERVDYHGNLALLEEAQRTGVRRFIYVSVYDAPGLDRLEYVAAHVRFAEALGDSGLEYTVVRPTGFFSFLGDTVRLARSGQGVVVGDGAARTNPVHEAEVAVAVAGAAQSARPDPVINVGGPDVLTRREIVELAFRAVGRPPRITRVPPGVLRAAASAVTPLNPRLGALLRFGVEVCLVDVVAPVRGTRRLIDYYRALAVSRPGVLKR